MSTPARPRPLPPARQEGQHPGPAAPTDDIPGPNAVGQARLHWVPIRSLTPRHRERIAAHLLALDSGDRYLRFGHVATDAEIQRYVDALDFERDEVFGIFNRRLLLIAMAHLAYAAAPAALPGHGMAEFGVSVRPQARGRGYGARLFAHAVLHARNRGCDRLFIHALSENTAMLKIAAHAGATVKRDGSESQAWLQLPPDDLVSRVDEIVATQAAELNYRLKVQVRRVNEWLDGPKDASDHMSPEGRTRSE